MSIPSVTSVQPQTESRRTASGTGAAPGASFQSQLEQAASGASALAGQRTVEHSAFVREDPMPDLNSVKLLLLERAKKGKEMKKEQEEWDRLLKCLDGWIEALRAKNDGERAEKDSVIAEAGESLMALYESLIVQSAQAEAGSDPDQAREELLEALTESQSALLARLKEEKASEEEQEEWIQLLRKLDAWIESLRTEAEEKKDERIPAGMELPL